MTENWRKSTYSNGLGNCVEVDTSTGEHRVRDSKLGEASPVLTFTRDEWAAFVAGAKDGQFEA